MEEMDFDLTEEQKALRAQVAAFADKEIAPLAEKLDREAKFPTELFRKTGALGITRIPFEEKWGGMGLGTFEMVLALEQLARADQSLAVTTMSPPSRARAIIASMSMSAASPGSKM